MKDFKDKESSVIFKYASAWFKRFLFHVKHSMELTYPSYRSLYEENQRTRGRMNLVEN